VARRGTTKRYSVDHEEFIAKLYGGVRSPSSGAAEKDGGDVRTDPYLIECKMTGNPGEVKRKSKILQDLEKVWEEAVIEGKKPLLCLREFQPDSPLAGKDGWVDLTVLPSDDHAKIES
jgi:hypothetical protein